MADEDEAEAEENVWELCCNDRNCIRAQYIASVIVLERPLAELSGYRRALYALAVVTGAYASIEEPSSYGIRDLLEGMTRIILDEERSFRRKRKLKAKKAISSWLAERFPSS